MNAYKSLDISCVVIVYHRYTHTHAEKCRTLLKKWMKCAASSLPPCYFDASFSSSIDNGKKSTGTPVRFCPKHSICLHPSTFVSHYLCSFLTKNLRAKAFDRKCAQLMKSTFGFLALSFFSQNYSCKFCINQIISRRTHFAQYFSLTKICQELCSIEHLLLFFLFQHR